MYLIGASGHAKVIVDILRLCDKEINAFYDDDPEKKELLGIPVLDTVNNFNEAHGPCLISIGNNKVRKKIAENVNAAFTKAIHPNSVVADNVKVGDGVVVMACAVVNSDVSIGDHAIVNTMASIDHDCNIGKFAHISPNATLCGGVNVGEGTHIGAGAVIIPNVRIGNWVTIGAGTVVIKDVPDFATVVGNPGKVIKLNQ